MAHGERGHRGIAYGREEIARLVAVADQYVRRARGFDGRYNVPVRFRTDRDDHRDAGVDANLLAVTAHHQLAVDDALDSGFSEKSRVMLVEPEQQLSAIVPSHFACHHGLELDDGYAAAARH